MISQTFRYPRWINLLFYILLSAMMVTGCGSGGGDDTLSAESTEDSGTLAISLTDAPGDFASYTVDVIALTLTKANGAQVSTLPLSARIDFAQYTEMTEFITAARVPAGVYTAATLTLDYSNADIWVEGPSGELVQAAQVLNEDGTALTTVAVSVQLNARNRLRITAGVPAHLMLDFDLSATHQVAFGDQGEAVITADPYLIADVNRNAIKTQRLRGLLDEVDAAASSFSVYVRPFYCALSGSDNPFGTVSVYTDDDTLFEVNGETYQGADGLTAMADLDALTPVVALGNLSFDPLRFQAAQVYAGTSVPWGDADIVSGTVVARSGDVLSVKGATLISSDGSVLFHDVVSVTLSADTPVSRQFSAGAFTIDDISVGQRVTVYGTLTNDDPLDPALDASEGYVRMLITTVRGTVVEVTPAAAAAQLTIDLQSINQHAVGIFDFSGTGTDSTNDADPADYEIATGALDLSDLAQASPVKLRGFVQPFGQAPADFNALTMIDVTDVRAFLKVQWQPATADPFETISADGLTLNLDGVAMPHHLYRAWVITDLTGLGQSPVVIPAEDGLNLYVLRGSGWVQVYTDFESYVTDLETYLADGSKVKKIWSVGAFDDAAATLSAEMIDIQLW